MKRAPSGDSSPGQSALQENLSDLAQALVDLDDVEAMRAFLTDLCTPAELEALTDRWRVVPLLMQGTSYRQIYELTGVSVTTVGRVARHLEYGAGGYAAAWEHRNKTIA